MKQFPGYNPGFLSHVSQEKVELEECRVGLDEGSSEIKTDIGLQRIIKSPINSPLLPTFTSQRSTNYYSKKSALERAIVNPCIGNSSLWAWRLAMKGTRQPSISKVPLIFREECVRKSANARCLPLRVAWSMTLVIEVGRWRRSDTRSNCGHIIKPPAINARSLNTPECTVCALQIDRLDRMQRGFGGNSRRTTIPLQ